MSSMPQAAPRQETAKTTVSIGNWIGSIVLAAIPLVGLICLLVWAFGGSTIKSKKNWAIAMLIFMAASIVLGAVWWSLLRSFFESMMGSYLY